MPDHKGLRVFGCSCFPHLHPYNQHKLQYRSQECVYLGLSPHHKGHKCLVPNGRIYISKDVVFIEASFPYQSLFISVPQSQPQSQSSYSSTVPLVSPSLSQISLTQSESSIIPNSSPPSDSDPQACDSPQIDPASAVFSLPYPNSTQALQPQNTNTHHMVTRSKIGHLKPKVFLTHIEPSNIKQALSSPEWLAAMQAKYDALMQNDTWSLVPLPPHRAAIGYEWVFSCEREPSWLHKQI